MAIEVASSTATWPMRTKRMQPAEKTKLAASSQKAHSMGSVDAIRPDAAKPMAVDPKVEIDISEFAAASSSSLAISGRTLSLAGSKNGVIAEETRTKT